MQIDSSAMQIPFRALEILVIPSVQIKLTTSDIYLYRYQADHVYGHATIYFMCAIIGMFMVANYSGRILAILKKDNPSKGNKSRQQVVGVVRYLSNKTFRVQALGWYSPSMGVILLGLAGVIYFFCKLNLTKNRAATNMHLK